MEAILKTKLMNIVISGRLNFIFWIYFTSTISQYCGFLTNKLLHTDFINDKAKVNVEA